MKFKKEDLQEAIGDPDTTVLDEIVGKSRWSIEHRRVFRHEGKFYETHYSRGATESQDERAYEHDDDEIECPEVFAREKTVTVYEQVGR